MSTSPSPHIIISTDHQNDKTTFNLHASPPQPDLPPSQSSKSSYITITTNAYNNLSGNVQPFEANHIPQLTVLPLPPPPPHTQYPYSAQNFATVPTINHNKPNGHQLLQITPTVASLGSFNLDNFSSIHNHTTQNVIAPSALQPLDTLKNQHSFMPPPIPVSQPVEPLIPSTSLPINNMSIFNTTYATTNNVSCQQPPQTQTHKISEKSPTTVSTATMSSGSISSAPDSHKISISSDLNSASTVFLTQCQEYIKSKPQLKYVPLPTSKPLLPPQQPYIPPPPQTTTTTSLVSFGQKRPNLATAPFISPARELSGKTGFTGKVFSSVDSSSYHTPDQNITKNAVPIRSRSRYFNRLDGYQRPATRRDTPNITEKADQSQPTAVKLATNIQLLNNPNPPSTQHFYSQTIGGKSQQRYQQHQHVIRQPYNDDEPQQRPLLANSQSLLQTFSVPSVNNNITATTTSHNNSINFAYQFLPKTLKQHQQTVEEYKNRFISNMTRANPNNQSNNLKELSFLQFKTSGGSKQPFHNYRGTVNLHTSSNQYYSQPQSQYPSIPMKNAINLNPVDVNERYVTHNPNAILSVSTNCLNSHNDDDNDNDFGANAKRQKLNNGAIRRSAVNTTPSAYIGMDPAETQNFLVNLNTNVSKKSSNSSVSIVDDNTEVVIEMVPARTNITPPSTSNTTNTTTTSKEREDKQPPYITTTTISTLNYLVYSPTMNISTHNNTNNYNNITSENNNSTLLILPDHLALPKPLATSTNAQRDGQKFQLPTPVMFVNPSTTNNDSLHTNFGNDGSFFQTIGYIPPQHTCQAPHHPQPSLLTLIPISEVSNDVYHYQNQNSQYRQQLQYQQQTKKKNSQKPTKVDQPYVYSIPFPAHPSEVPLPVECPTCDYTAATLVLATQHAKSKIHLRNRAAIHSQPQEIRDKFLYFDFISKKPFQQLQRK